MEGLPVVVMNLGHEANEMYHWDWKEYDLLMDVFQIPEFLKLMLENSLYSLNPR